MMMMMMMMMMTMKMMMKMMIMMMMMMMVVVVMMMVVVVVVTFVIMLIFMMTIGMMMQRMSVMFFLHLLQQLEYFSLDIPGEVERRLSILQNQHLSYNGSWKMTCGMGHGFSFQEENHLPNIHFCWLPP